MERSGVPMFQLSKNIIRNIIVIVSVLNLIFLFGFNYQIPSILRPGSDTQAEEDAYVDEEMDSTESALQESDGTDTAAIDTAAAGEPAPEDNTAADAQPAGDTAAVQEQAADGTATAPGEEPAQTGTGPQYVVSAQTAANVRSGPGTGNDVVASLPSGTLLEVTGEAQDGWYPIRSETGVEGYIKENYITMVGQE